MTNTTIGGSHGVRLTLFHTLEVFEIADDIALLSHRHNDTQIKQQEWLYCQVHRLKSKREENQKL